VLASVDDEVGGDIGHRSAGLGPEVQRVAPDLVGETLRLHQAEGLEFDSTDPVGCVNSVRPFCREIVGAQPVASARALRVRPGAEERESEGRTRWGASLLDRVAAGWDRRRHLIKRPVTADGR
jgi:hypothetical protein